MKRRQKIWLLLTSVNRTDLDAVLPTLAWMAEKADAVLDAYLEVHRTGRLFAQSGSTVLGGRHHQQFNYLAAAADLHILKLGDSYIFDSSIDAFRLPVIAAADTAIGLYEEVSDAAEIDTTGEIFVMPDVPVVLNECDLRPYLYPHIYFERRIGLPESELSDILPFPGKRVHLDIGSECDLGKATLTTAEQYVQQANGVAFGDPDAIRSMLPALCYERRVSLYHPRASLERHKVRFSTYTEATSPIVDEVARLALQTGNPVITGRQTGDGDIIAWSRHGVCIQIMDPNRPAFRSVEKITHPWRENTTDPFAKEPDEEELLEYAQSGKILASLLWHSGEIAHNEAMLNLIELCGIYGLKMGIGVHHQRYSTCPQLWEMLNADPDTGGARGLVEPVLHSGGAGVLAEWHTPPEALANLITNSLNHIRSIAGDTNVPQGYYAFMDAPLTDLTQSSPSLYEVMSHAGLKYCISSVSPGINRIVHDDGTLIAINQSSRSICPASPFVRITTVEDLIQTGSIESPGWILGTLDSPVISFSDYIWKKGNRFMEIVDFLLNSGRVINVLPRTVARYARILKTMQALR